VSIRQSRAAANGARDPYRPAEMIGGKVWRGEACRGRQGARCRAKVGARWHPGRQRKEPPMSSLILWSCTAAGCTSGKFLNDAQGRADHQTAYGHAPVPGRPLGWAWDRGAA
jgi:hypothetical protein